MSQYFEYVRQVIFTKHLVKIMKDKKKGLVCGLLGSLCQRLYLRNHITVLHQKKLDGSKQKNYKISFSLKSSTKVYYGNPKKKYK